MKKLIVMLLLLSLAVLPAMAETKVTCEIMGKQMLDEGGYAMEVNILRFSFAGGGVPIPDVYALAEDGIQGTGEESWLMQDVNFDGAEDLVIVTAAGAANTRFTFYLWDAASGSYQFYGGEDLWNYQLYPAQKLILSTGTSGWAGLLHENKVYAWDGTGKNLTLLRASEWNTLEESSAVEENGYMVTTSRSDDSVMVESYVDYVKGTDESVSFPTKQYDDPVFQAERFQIEEEFLGLEVTQMENDDGTNG